MEINNIDIEKKKLEQENESLKKENDFLKTALHQLSEIVNRNSTRTIDRLLQKRRDNGTTDRQSY